VVPSLGADLPAETCRRHDTVQAWCSERQIRPSSKIVVANKIIDLAYTLPVLDHNELRT